ncbi:hypothetical protein F8388_022403 [Cannabis sativa]|uniref:Uncharacterized protein n=1 Tax=Cannabis sativa TaxID=3483 RepID=A0A7J6EWN2_CANSA|nr:hypothetical protein G4B88_001213 [Cannabis sativa]KAF4362746.1 hypothetical protein F8388_022403 [Cannabis sativa]
MNGTKVSVLKNTHQVSLGSLLKSGDGAALETKISLEILSDFPDKPLERQLPDEKLSALLTCEMLDTLRNAKIARVDAGNVLRERPPPVVPNYTHTLEFRTIINMQFIERSEVLQPVYKTFQILINQKWNDQHYTIPLDKAIEERVSNETIDQHFLLHHSIQYSFLSGKRSLRLKSV